MGRGSYIFYVLIGAAMLIGCESWRVIASDRPGIFPPSSPQAWRPLLGKQWFQRSPFSMFPNHFHSLFDDSSIMNDFVEWFPQQVEQDQHNHPECRGKQQKSEEFKENGQEDLWERERLNAWNTEYEKRKAAFDEREAAAKEQYISQMNAEKNRLQRLEDYHRQKREAETRRRQEREAEIKRRQIVEQEKRRQEFEAESKRRQLLEEEKRRQELEEQRQRELLQERRRKELLEQQRRKELDEQRRKQELERLEEERRNKQKEMEDKQAEFNRQHTRRTDKDRPGLDEHLNVHHQNAVDGETVFITSVKIPGHSSRDISIKTINNEVHIKGHKHIPSNRQKVQTFHKIILLPEDIDPKSIRGTVDTRGNLQITGIKLSEPWYNDDGPLIEPIDERLLHESESESVRNFSKLNREYYDEDLTIEVFEY